MKQTTTFHVALIGRANVGKSTLFNALSSQNRSLIAPIAGTTRDINYAQVAWGRTTFELMDTAGLDLEEASELERNVVKQAKAAQKKADIILFVCDVHDGVLTSDRSLAKQLIKQQKPIFLVVNKADNPTLRNEATAFLKLGFKNIFFTSAVNGSGLGDLLDGIVEKIKELHLKTPKKIDYEKPVPTVKLAIVGRPNVGKSSLLNTLIGEYRAVVSPIPHTTRNINDAIFEHNGTHFLIVDTAGIRKKAKTKPGIEKLSITQTLKAIHDCDVVALLFEANSDIETIDKRIAEIVMEKKKGVILIANKWDLIDEKSLEKIQIFNNYVRKCFPSLPYAEILCMSAKTGQHTKKLLDVAKQIYDRRAMVIPTEKLDAFIRRFPYRIAKFSKRGDKRYPKIFGMSQTGTHPPAFTITVRKRDILSEGYMNYLENRFRDLFDMSGTPIKVLFHKIIPK